MIRAQHFLTDLQCTNQQGLGHRVVVQLHMDLGQRLEGWR